jgi:hypothetical protein
MWVKSEVENQFASRWTEAELTYLKIMQILFMFKLYTLLESTVIIHKF